MSAQYLSIRDFKAYQTTTVLPALATLDINLKNPNKLNQFAAKMLGFASYEALQPFHQRERNIADAIHMEICPFQSGRMTAKAGNILVVFDQTSQMIHMRALAPGQERDFVDLDSSHTTTTIFYEDEPMPDFSQIRTKHLTGEGGRVDFELDATRSNGDSTKMLFSLIRTEEGVILNVYADSQGDCESYTDVGVEFSDTDCEEFEAVDQANALTGTMPGSDGVHYKWLRPTMTEDGWRFLNVGDPGQDEIILSEMMFESPERALECIDNEDYGYDAERVEDCVIVRVTRSIVPR